MFQPIKRSYVPRQSEVRELLSSLKTVKAADSHFAIRQKQEKALAKIDINDPMTYAHNGKDHPIIQVIKKYLRAAVEDGDFGWLEKASKLMVELDKIMGKEWTDALRAIIQIKKLAMESEKHQRNMDVSQLSDEELYKELKDFKSATVTPREGTGTGDQEA